MTDLTPGSPEWARRVSPSKAAAILGISPWDSQRSMWHKMRGDVAWDAETPAMERGNLLEAGVLAWWRKHYHCPGAAYAEQVTMTIDDWCVATPDAIARGDDGLVLVEAKTTASLDDWGDPGTDEVPLYYLAQVYLAMHVAHLNNQPVVRAEIPVLAGPRVAFSRYVVPYSEEHGAAVLASCREFYDSLDAADPPELDDTLATYDAVRKVHKDIDPDLSVELDPAAAHDLVHLTAAAKALEPQVRRAKSVAIDAMGQARYLTSNGVRIARRQRRGEDVTFHITAKPADLTTELETAS